MQKTTLSQLVSETLNVNDRVIVFTQDMTVVEDFLLNYPGRWNVAINEELWPSIQSDKICKGVLKKGFKAALVDGRARNAEIGLDHGASRVIFTKNPWFPTKHGDAVLKDWFRFPTIKIVDNKSYLHFIDFHPSCFIKTESVHEYNRLHDLLSFQNIEHSTGFEDFKSIHVAHSPRYTAKHTALLYVGAELPQRMMGFHNCEEIYLVEDINMYRMEYRELKEIEKIFIENPMMGIHPDFVAFRIGLHPASIKRMLNFLCLCGVLKKAHSDSQTITLFKMAKKEDEFYDRIPQGTFTISTLAKHLRIDRQEVIPILKKYEVHITYVPASEKQLYIHVNGLNDTQYRKALDATTEMHRIYGELANNAERYINRYIETKIEKHCKESSSKAVLFAEGQANIIEAGEEYFIPGKEP